MAGMRDNKKAIREALTGEDWEKKIPEIAKMGKPAVSPLFSLLLLDPETKHRAAKALGETVDSLAKTDLEAAKNVIRRFMWHMNEESGNIGWGIPDAFAECLVANAELAKTYASILRSYIIDLGFDDNYCDHDILRRSCYWAIGRLAQARPELAEPARPWLLKGLEDRDSVCRGMAAWALGQLKPELMDAPALKKLAESGDRDECEYFDNATLRRGTVSDLARESLEKDLGMG
ncbi:MAG: HEAT repeat domain-containing protein [Desulfovibrio sp.]|nr:HEAT repeat domain-containing protein [Desulfovibrio sp.]